MSRSEASLASTLPALPPLAQAAPAGFAPHVFEKHFLVRAPRAAAWRWLEDPATFSQGQVWPYRVEFVSSDENPPGFHVGGLNVHHGPGLHLPGQLTEIDEGRYRDLQYFYGSFVLSPRLVRPTRLQFWLEDGDAAGGSTRVTLRLDSFVRSAFHGVWDFGNRLFWARFPRWMGRSLAGADA